MQRRIVVWLAASVAMLAVVTSLSGWRRFRRTITGPPVAHVQRQVCDLGELRPEQSTSTTAEFRIANRGVEPLRLIKLVSSCRCSKVRCSHTEVPSGREATVSVVIRPNASDANTGSALVEVQTNDPVRAWLSLRVTWKLVRPIELDPPGIELVGLSPGTAASGAVRVLVDSALLGNGLRLLAPRAHHDVQASLEGPFTSSTVVVPSGMPRQEYRLSVRVRTNQEPGWRFEKAVLELLGDSTVRVEVPISWQCVPKVIAIPESIHFGTLAPGQTITRTVRLLAKEKSPVSVRGCACRGDGLAIVNSADSTSSASRTTYSLQLRAPEAPGIYHGQVLFDVQEVDGPLKLPVSAFIVARPSAGGR